MRRSRLTLLVEDLSALAAAAPETPTPILERCLARGRPLTHAATNADALRLALFGVHDTASGAAPVGALTAVADGLAQAGDGRHWLRVDPVTLTADMTRVFMTAHGLADADEAERAELRACVADTLTEAGHALLHGHPERWLLALEAAPPFTFMRLDDALGRDMAEALPNAPEARAWRRLLTDLQVALHNAEVNRRRRARGVREINAAWIWGGGRLPPGTPDAAFQCVVSDHPVSRGLAALAGTAVQPEAECEAALALGGELAWDWQPGAATARAALERLERQVAALAGEVARGRLALTLVDGGGRGWRVDRAVLHRFWRRPRPLRDHFPADTA